MTYHLLARCPVQTGRNMVDASSSTDQGAIDSGRGATLEPEAVLGSALDDVVYGCLSSSRYAGGRIHGGDYALGDDGCGFDEEGLWEQGLRAIEEFDWLGTARWDLDSSCAIQGCGRVNTKEESVLGVGDGVGGSWTWVQDVVPELSPGVSLDDVAFSRRRTPDLPPQVGQKGTSAEGRDGMDEALTVAEQVRAVVEATESEELNTGNVSITHEAQLENTQEKTRYPLILNPRFIASTQTTPAKSNTGAPHTIRGHNLDPFMIVEAKPLITTAPQKRAAANSLPNKARDRHTPATRRKEKSTRSVKSPAKAKVAAMSARTKATNVGGSRVMSRQTRSASASEEAIRKEREEVVKDEVKESRMKTLRKRGG